MSTRSEDDRQARRVDQLEAYLDRHPGAGLEALRQTVVNPRGVRVEDLLIQRSYLGMLMCLHPLSFAPEWGPEVVDAGRRVVDLMRRIEQAERSRVEGESSEDVRALQRLALYRRLSWPRSTNQLRVGLAVRLGLEPRTGFMERELLGLSSELDGRVAEVFGGGSDEVTAGVLVVALGRIASFIARSPDNIVPLASLSQLADEEVPAYVLRRLADCLIMTEEAVRLLWAADGNRWRAGPMKARVVPHGESAAEFRPLLRHADWLLVPNPRAVPIAAEHLADALALGRGGVWPQFGGQTDDAPIRAARGRALEGAVESALRSALSAGTSSRHRIYRSVNHSTSIPRPGVKWSSGGEVDVLVGCGALQIAIECKAGDYDGRGVPPAKFVSEPIAQLTKWRTARQSDTLRFAADNNGRPFNDEEEAHLRALIRAPAALDVVLTLDDFGYMPTAAPLMFRVSRSEVDAGAAPIYMCLPDFVELCEVLRGRDLLTYLTVRAQLTHTDLPHHLPEDGCLALFLETGHISRLSQDEQDEVLKQASMDHEGLFAWKVQRQFTEHPTVPTPQPRRSEGLRELLNSLVRPGEEAEVAHIVAATILPGAIGSEQDATDRIRRQKPSIFRNPTGQTLLIIDRLKGDLATWTRSEVFIEQALKAFRPGMAPKLVVVIHTTDRGSQIRVHGEVPVLVKSRVEAAALEEALIDGSALKRLENLALDRKAPCPCGSGLKHRKCRRMRKHRVPLPD